MPDARYQGSGQISEKWKVNSKEFTITIHWTLQRDHSLQFRCIPIARYSISKSLSALILLLRKRVYPCQVFFTFLRARGVLYSVYSYGSSLALSLDKHLWKQMSRQTSPFKETSLKSAGLHELSNSLWILISFTESFSFLYHPLQLSEFNPGYRQTSFWNLIFSLKSEKWL